MKIAIVTGASKGLGRAIAIGLAADGFALALSARDVDGLNETAEACRKAGAPDALVVASDLSKAEAPQQVVDAVLERFNTIDLLVNNAGATKRADFLSLTDSDFLDGFQLKFHATVRFCRAAWGALAASQGSIINISGIGAHTPEPDFTVGGSVNSALLNFTKAIAKRASADKIRVNALCPGHIVTDRLAARIRTIANDKGISFEAAQETLRIAQKIDRFGTPEEIANVVAFLASDKAAYIHGTTLTVDGGATPGI